MVDIRNPPAVLLDRGKLGSRGITSMLKVLFSWVTELSKTCDADILLTQTTTYLASIF